jgi:hypothetical protein
LDQFDLPTLVGVRGLFTEVPLAVVQAFIFGLLNNESTIEFIRHCGRLPESYAPIIGHYAHIAFPRLPRPLALAPTVSAVCEYIEFFPFLVADHRPDLLEVADRIASEDNAHSLRPLGIRLDALCPPRREGGATDPKASLMRTEASGGSSQNTCGSSSSWSAG